MSRKIKLIWDFRGPVSAKTAEHHEIHLKEFIVAEKLPLNITGFEVYNEMYACAAKCKATTDFDVDIEGAVVVGDSQVM